jgi:hypothetical protein
MPPPYDLRTARLARELARRIEGVQTQLRALEREGVGAVEAAGWLRVMQRRGVSFEAVLAAVREGHSPSSWRGSD